jgi:hypothetical protein
MIRTLTVIAALAAVASPAMAEVKVNITGKDAATVETLITDAAGAACRQELRGSVNSFANMRACVEAAKDDAMAKVATMRGTTYAAERAPLAVTRISN